MHIKGTRTMLKDSELGKDLWGEALLTHVYIHNQCPSSTLPDGSTPYEKVFRHAPYIGHLRVFGSKCYIKIPDETRSKLDDKARECRLIGFESNSIYIVFDQTWKKLRSSDVIFIEDQSNQRDKTDSPLEFSSQAAEVTNEKDTHIENEEDTNR